MDMSIRLDKRNWTRAGFWFGLALVIGLAATAFDLLDQRNQARTEHVKQLATSTDLLSEHVYRSLQILDGTLLNVVDKVKQEGMSAVSGDAGHAYLQSQVRHLSGNAQLLAYNLAGVTLSASATREPPSFNPSERDYFKALMAGQPEPYIDRALLGNTSHKYFFPMARRLINQKSEMVGIIQLGVNMDYLNHVFRFGQDPNSQSALIRRQDGILVSSADPTPELMGRVILPPSEVAQLGTLSTPRVETLNILGAPQLLGVQRVKDYDLLVLHWSQTRAQELMLGAAPLGPWILALLLGLSGVLGLRAWQRDGKDRDALHAQDQLLLKERNELLQQQETIYKNAMVCLAIFEGRTIRWINQASLDLVGRSPQEMIGQSTRIFFATDEYWRDLGQRTWAAHSAGKPFSEEIQLQHKDGSMRWAHLSMRVVDPTQQPMQAVAVLTDLTERKRLEDKLRSAMEAAQQSDAAKSEFLSIVSHELRTPLNGVMGGLQTLGFFIKDAKPKELLRASQESGELLMNAINDLLDFTKIEAGKLDLYPEPTQLTVLCKRLSSMAQNIPRHDSVKLEFECDPALEQWVQVDGQRLRQVMNNLLNNALKFTHQGTVYVAGRIVSRDRDRLNVQLVVQDTGIGMSTETISKLFTPFTQASGGLRRKYGGTGLGLSICKRLLDAMGGEIHVQSLPGVGSTFTVTLNLQTTDVPVKAN